MRSRLARALPLLTALALLLPWSIWAIVVDDTPSQPGDSIALRASHIARDLRRGELPRDTAVLARDKTPPLSATVAALLAAAFGVSLTVLRLGGLACYVLLMWQSHDLARQCGASRRTAGWAAFLCGVSPVLFGWARMDYADIYAATLTASCLQVMIRGHLTYRRAVILGLLAGLAVLTKLGFVIYIVAPALWFAGGHLRRPAHRRMLAVAAAVTIVVAGWWLVLLSDIIANNIGQSTQAWDRASPLLHWLAPYERKLLQIKLYLWDIPGITFLWGGAAAALILLRRSPGARQRALLGMASLLTLLLLLAFDHGVRYLTALVAPAAVLCSLAVAHLSGRLRSRPRQLGAEAALAAALLGFFVWLNLVPVRTNEARYDRFGMLHPVSTYTAACHELQEHRVGVVYYSPSVAEWLMGLPGDSFRACSFPAPSTEEPCQVLFKHADQRQKPGFVRRAGRGCPRLAVCERFAHDASLELVVGHMEGPP